MIAHDLAVLRYMCDTIGIIYLGEIVELPTSEDLCRRPSHPYTQELLAAVLPTEPTEWKPPLLAGEMPSPLDPPRAASSIPAAPMPPRSALARAPNTGKWHQGIWLLATFIEQPVHGFPAD